MATTKKQNDGSLKVDIIGLKELRKELKALDTKLPKEVTKAGKKVADMVARDAKSRFNALPGLGPATGEGLKTSGAGGASITLGDTQTRNGKAIILGTEFGGSDLASFKTKKGGHTHQFLPHRGRQGYALYPAIRENKQEIIDMYGDLIEDVAKAAFPD